MHLLDTKSVQKSGQKRQPLSRKAGLSKRGVGSAKGRLSASSSNTCTINFLQKIKHTYLWLGLEILCIRWSRITGARFDSS